MEHIMNVTITRTFHRLVTCKRRGHMSTGTFLASICDRCHATFIPKHQSYQEGQKISTER